MIKFRLSTHGTTSEPMVEVWRDDTFVASIYGHEEGVRLVSKHFDGVAYDPGSPPAGVIKLSHIQLENWQGGQRCEVSSIKYSM